MTLVEKASMRLTKNQAVGLEGFGMAAMGLEGFGMVAMISLLLVLSRHLISCTRYARVNRADGGWKERGD